MNRPTTKHDEYDRQTCIAGLAIVLQDMFSNTYKFTYYLTFKREMKDYAAFFNDADERPVEDLGFFNGINDPLVQHCAKTAALLSDFIQKYKLRHGICEEEIFEDEVYQEAERYAPNRLPSLKRKSYVFMKFNYERYLEEISNTLYYYCCALSLNSYLLPVKMRVALDYSEKGSFRYLNMDNYDVIVLTELIMVLDSERAEFFG